ETSVIRTLKNQLLSLTIDISTQKLQHFPIDGNAIIFNHIITMFTNLQYLNFGPSSICDEQLYFCFDRLTVVSTNLLELHVCLNTFSDCLYLLHGHFNQLRTFYADKKLSSLKCFRLHRNMITFAYDELILPLLHRMSNLEKLDLSINVGERKTL
ncbi:unnamed protein product, partial [Rotaria sp. Silwood2]